MKVKIREMPEREDDGYAKYDEALREMQIAMKDVDRTGLETEEEIVAMCKEVRRSLVY